MRSVQPLVGWQAVGVSVEHLAVSKLLLVGHKVAMPVTDDDGVDLIVNYRTTVQVKSCGTRRSGAIVVALRNKRPGRGPYQAISRDVDFLLVYARDSGVWWVVPMDVVPAGTRLGLREDPDSKFGCYCEAWHLLGERPTLRAAS